MSNAVAEPRPGLVAEPEDLELAELVGERLARPDDVAIDLVLDVVGAEGRVLEHERIARSRDQPIAWMPVSTTSRAARQASNDSTPSRSRSPAVEAHLVGEALGVQAPALDERGRARGCAGTPAGARAPGAIAIWRWWPGIDSW